MKDFSDMSIEGSEMNVGILKDVERIARITLCGCIHFDISDNMNFIKPTPEQIQNLHDNFCIDVELFDDINGEESD